jgi:hypothetical protein
MLQEVKIIFKQMTMIIQNVHQRSSLSQTEREITAVVNHESHLQMFKLGIPNLRHMEE